MGRVLMFGKSYETIGESSTNLILKTAGDLKIQWGNKYIDLLKNGKIGGSTDVEITEVSSENQMTSNGIYVLNLDDSKSIWICYNGEKISTNSIQEAIIYSNKLTLTGELKLQALSNIGFIYNTYEEASASNMESGIVYVINDKSFYTVANKQLTLFTINQSSSENGESNILMDKTFDVYSNGEAIISYDSNLYIKVPVILSYGIESVDYNDYKGYSLLTDSGYSTLELDKIIVRDTIEYKQLSVDCTYSRLLQILPNITESKTYILTDYYDTWNTTKTYKLILKNKLKECYILSNYDWKIEYDVSKIRIGDTNNYYPGTITKLTDSNNNTANFNFRNSDLFVYKIESDYTAEEWNTVKNNVFLDYKYNVHNCNITTAPGQCKFLKNAINVNIANASGTTFNKNVTNLTADALTNVTFNGTVQDVKAKSISNNTFTNINNVTFHTPITIAVTEDLSSSIHKDVYLIDNTIVIYSMDTIIPKGTVVMWGLPNDIPYGWAMCDGGTYNGIATPDLRNAFIKGATSIDTIGVNDSSHLDGTNTDNKIKLTESNLPAHSHPHKEHTHIQDAHTHTLNAHNHTLDAHNHTQDEHTHTVTTHSHTSEDATIFSVISEESDTKDAAVSESSLTTSGTTATNQETTATNLEATATNLETTAVNLSATSEEEEKEWTNEAIKIEPYSYSLIYIMKV